MDTVMKGGLGHPALAICADLVSADCRRCEWYAVEVKASALDEDGWLALLDEDERTGKMAESAFAAFAMSGSQEYLCTEIAKVIERLNHRSDLPRNS
ncbi:hypothetical protein QFZ27_001668 [Inquilinus ginsengisoli]|uniref:hypothetical protein n=1 Tax=Inquilinus ginsengisoli TaxID=363840 RepID=UPI003D1B331D